MNIIYVGELYRIFISMQQVLFEIFDPLSLHESLKHINFLLNVDINITADVFIKMVDILSQYISILTINLFFEV